jgi:hypothetical protein
MGFPRQEYCSWLPFPSPGFFLTLGLNLLVLHWQECSLPLSHLGSPAKNELSFSKKMGIPEKEQHVNSVKQYGIFRNL